LNQCFIDWKKTVPRSRISYRMCFQGGFGDFFTFYELESSSRWLFQFGMWEASKRDCEGKQCCCCPHFPRPSSGRENPPLKKAECLLGLPSFSEGEKAQHEKGGEEGHPPPSTHNFIMHSSPHLPINVAKKTDRQTHDTGTTLIFTSVKVRYLLFVNHFLFVVPPSKKVAILDRLSTIP